MVFTVLHAGGKFGQGGYKTSGGLHGVGASVVNALSEKLTVNTVRDGIEYEEDFVDGGHPVGTLRKIGKTKKQSGTTVTFKPDKKIFSTTHFNYDTLAERLRESAFLLKGVKIVLTDERNDDQDVFLFENGIQEFVSYLNEEKDTLGNVMYFEGKKDGIEVEVAAQYNDGYSETIMCQQRAHKRRRHARSRNEIRLDQSIQRVCKKGRSDQGKRQKPRRKRRQRRFGLRGFRQNSGRTSSVRRTDKGQARNAGSKNRR